MKLFYATTSPFARKVRISAEIMGLSDRMELVVADINTPDAGSTFKKINPLVKIPSFQTDDGEMLINSPFICEYLNSMSLGKKILPVGPERWGILNDQSVADGAVDAAVLRVMETRRNPQFFDIKWDKRQKTKMENSLDYFTENFYRLQSEWTLREISVVCMIGYIQLRFAHEKWNERYPRLWNWYEAAMEKYPAVRNSKPN